MMNENEPKSDENWEMLGHDPVPGYKIALYTAVVISVIYLIFAFTAVGGH